MRMFFLMSVVLVAVTIVKPQKSGPQYYRSAVLSGNNISTVFGNWGVLAQPGDSRPHGSWMYPANGYIGDESILIGVEFPIQDYNNDGKSDTVHSVITSPVVRPVLSFDKDLSTGDYWTFMPESSSVNSSSESVPISTDTSSWPTSWRNGQGKPAWKGLLEAGKVLGSQEAFFTMNDENDHRFDTPANNKFNKNITGISGQGIRVTVRFIQFNDTLLNNILFRIFDISNVGNTNFSNVVFGSLMGTYVGITGNNHAPAEYNDDYSILKKNEGVIITGDYNNDCSGNPAWIGSVGKYGVGFIDAPMNNALGSFSYFTPSSQIPLGDDEKLWSMMRVGTYSTPSNVMYDSLPWAGLDGDFVYGTYSFPLGIHQTKRIATALTYGYTNAEVIQNVEHARKYYKEQLSAVPNAIKLKHEIPTGYSLTQNYPNPFNPSTVISYQLPVNSNVSLIIYDLLGREIVTLVNEEQSAGWKEVEWNASSFSSGMYLVRMLSGSFVETKKIMLMK